MSDTFSLAGRNAVVIGAGGEIGAAIAELFAAHGAGVVVADRSTTNLQAVEGRCLAAGSPRVVHAEVDVTSGPSVDELVHVVEAGLGHADILVNSAGFISEAAVVAMTQDEWNAAIAVNLTGVFRTCAAFLPSMIDNRWGRIINIASQVGQKGGPRFAHYAASKAGVIGFTKSLAQEVASAGVLVNAIAPGPVDTAFVSSLDRSTIAQKLSELPLGRAGTPREVAPTALLLATDPGGSTYVGQTLGPNGGDVML
jgi:3-oxoacyl-[acyl-carrier protein] reductase